MTTKHTPNSSPHFPQSIGLTPRKAVILACGLVLLALLAITPTLLKTASSSSQAGQSIYPNAEYKYYTMHDYEICGNPEDDADQDSIANYIELSADTDGDTLPNCRDVDSDGDKKPDSLEGIVKDTNNNNKKAWVDSQE